MALPGVNFSTHGDPVGGKNRHLRAAGEHRLDRQISSEEYVRKVLTEIGSAEKEAIDGLKTATTERKTALERRLNGLRFQVKTALADLEKELPRLERMSLQRKCSQLTMELKQAEQNLFSERCKLDTELQERIQELLDNAQLTAKIEQLFVVHIRSHL